MSLKLNNSESSKPSENTRRNTQSETSPEAKQVPEELSQNDALLLEHPELSQYFWQDNRWIVSDKLFNEFLKSLDISLIQEPIPAEADIFNVSRPDYDQNFATHSYSNKFKRVTPSASITYDDVINTLSYDLCESFGFHATELENSPCTWIEPTVETEENSWIINGCEIFMYRLVGTHTDGINRDMNTEDATEIAIKGARDATLRHTDKVAQRVIATRLSSSGILNPRYQDLRMINPPKHVIVCDQINTLSLPSATDIIDTINKEPDTRHLWIIEDDTQGFVIVHDHDELYVTTSNISIHRDASFAGVLQSSTQSELYERQQALREFLKMVQQKQDLSMAFLAKQQPQSYDTTALVTEIQSHPEPLYIKGTRTSGGEFVVRHKRLPTGKSILESDSPEFGYSLSISINSLKSCLKNPPAWQKQILPKFISRCSTSGTLGKILWQMETPILEEEIPVARYTTKAGIEKCEFRAIFQGLESPELVATYAKASLKDIAANISIAGRGRHTVQVIRGIMQQNLSGTLEQAEINKRAAQTLKRFEDTVSNFAEQFAAELIETTRLKDFAVDVVPVWNEEKQDLDFFLLEVQYAYGYKGLTAVDPDSATRVATFKSKINRTATALAAVDRLGRFFAGLT